MTLETTDPQVVARLSNNDPRAASATTTTLHGGKKGYYIVIYDHGGTAIKSFKTHDRMGYQRMDEKTSEDPAANPFDNEG